MNKTIQRGKAYRRTWRTGSPVKRQPCRFLSTPVKTGDAFKITGLCPVEGINGNTLCSDTTGEHHTVLLTSREDLEEVCNNFHVTRIETSAKYDNV